MPFLHSMDNNATQSEIFKRWPELAKPLGELMNQLMRNGPFSNEQAEFIFAYTSGINACQYCHNIHRYTAELYGVNVEIFEKVFEDIDAAPIENKMKTLLKFIRKLTKTPSKMVQKDADSVFNAGWSETEFQYAISICAAANYMNRILDGHGIKGTPETWKKRGNMLFEFSYGEVHSGMINSI